MIFPKDKIDYEEFLKLAEKLTEEQYDEEVGSNYQEVLDKHEWFPKPEQKTKAINVGVEDLTNTKYEDIAAKIKGQENIKIGKFLIKIKRYHGSAEKYKNSETKLDITIMEEKEKIHRKVQIAKDTRFTEVPWISHFNGSVRDGLGLPAEVVVDIIRWLQVMDKMVIFF